MVASAALSIFGQRWTECVYSLNICWTPVSDNLHFIFIFSVVWTLFPHNHGRKSRAHPFRPAD